ncbi:hypothetical protein QBK99_03930 [Corticibacterium sp. UT-5YL-CI-8]|nr:hypothetical protein [Tianweitania sp. UT-5YL-CI-8]
MAPTGILAASTFALLRAKAGGYLDDHGAMAWLALHGADHLFGGIEPRGGERPYIGQAPCRKATRPSANALR